MSFKFSLDNIDLNWPDILWGYEHQLLGWRDVVEYANKCVMHGCNNENVIHLSMIDKENTSDLKEALIILSGSVDGYSTDKWLYIILLNLFNHKNELDDPLGEVESVYEDFDYPVEIESFVRYMPVSGTYDPAQHSAEENINRLYANWLEYLQRKALIFDVK